VPRDRRDVRQRCWHGWGKREGAVDSWFRLGVLEVLESEYSGLIIWRAKD
jgi:hypothetical protein